MMATLDPDPAAGKLREYSVFREEMIRWQFECRRCKMEPLCVLRCVPKPQPPAQIGVPKIENHIHLLKRGHELFP